MNDFVIHSVIQFFLRTPNAPSIMFCFFNVSILTIGGVRKEMKPRSPRILQQLDFFENSCPLYEDIYLLKQLSYK